MIGNQAARASNVLLHAVAHYVLALDAFYSQSLLCGPDLFLFQSQFVILFFYCIRSVVTECGFAKWMCLFMIGYAVTLLTLFLNFYICTYLSKDKVKQNRTVQNGIKKEN